MKPRLNKIVNFKFAGSTCRGTIIEIDKKDKLLILGDDGHRYPIGLEQIIEK